MSNKTKEDICIEKGLLTHLGTLAPMFAEVMDEWAEIKSREEAIGFSEWADDNGWWREDYNNHDGTSEKLWSKTSSCWENITTEQLYELYQQSKNKTP